jgi:hypothetical protein
LGISPFKEITAAATDYVNNFCCGIMSTGVVSFVANLGLAQLRLSVVASRALAPIARDFLCSPRMRSRAAEVELRPVDAVVDCRRRVGAAIQAAASPQQRCQDSPSMAPPLISATMDHVLSSRRQGSQPSSMDSSSPTLLS